MPIPRFSGGKLCTISAKEMGGNQAGRTALQYPAKQEHVK